MEYGIWWRRPYLAHRSRRSTGVEELIAQGSGGVLLRLGVTLAPVSHALLLHSDQAKDFPLLQRPLEACFLKSILKIIFNYVCVLS